MQTVAHINDFIGSLPRIELTTVWKVVSEGKVVQGVSATDNRESTARKYIESKYPGMVFTLQFSHYK